VGAVGVSVPTWMHGLPPPAVIRMKGRIERERDRQEQQQLVASMHELMANQRTLRALMAPQDARAAPESVQ